MMTSTPWRGLRRWLFIPSFMVALLAAGPSHGQVANIHPAGAGGLVPDVNQDVVVNDAIFLGDEFGGAYIMATFEGGSDFVIDPAGQTGDLTLGSDPHTSVTFIFDGEGSTLNVPGAAIDASTYKGFSIGGSGHGTLILQNGADAWIGMDGFETSYGFTPAALDFSTIGDSPGSTGLISLNGNGTTFNMTGQLLVGGFGAVGGDPSTGELIARNFAEINIQEARAGQRGLAVAVGDNSIGTATISDSSTLNVVGGISVAFGLDSSGTLNVTGENTTANIVDGLGFVGEQFGATGVINVSNGAMLTLSGTDPVLNDPATIEIARNGGVGALNVSSGGIFSVDPTVDSGQIRVGDAGGNGIGSINVADPGSMVQILKPNGGICLGCQGPAFGSLAVLNGGGVTVDGASGWIVVGEVDGTIGIVQVDGEDSTVNAGDRLCVGLGSDCVTEGGSGKVVVSNGGTVTATTLAIGNNSEVIAEGTGGNLAVGGATVKVQAGVLRAVGALNIDGPLEVGSQGTLLIEALTPEQAGLIDIEGSLTLYGNLVVELHDGVSKTDIDDFGSLLVTNGEVNGSFDLVFQDTKGNEIDSYSDLPTVALPQLAFNADGDLKVALCHRSNSVAVGAGSAAAHLAHGDTPGACE